MNRAIFIIFLPPLLIAMGYIAVLRMMGVPPGYPRLIGTLVLFLGGIYWLSRRGAGKKTKAVIPENHAPNS